MERPGRICKRQQTKPFPIIGLSTPERDRVQAGNFCRKVFHVRFILPSLWRPSVAVVSVKAAAYPLKRRSIFLFPNATPVQNSSLRADSHAPMSSVGGRRTIALLMISLAMTAVAAAQNKGRATLLDPNLPSYQPQPVPSPHDRGYIMPDGSLRIVGFDDMAGMVAKWNDEFTKTHPGIRFTPILKGNGTAIPAIDRKSVV